MKADYKLLQCFYSDDCENVKSDEDCDAWAANNFCFEKWDRYMAENCQKSCGFCGGK